MDAMLQNILVLIYVEIVISIGISFCARKQVKSGKSQAKTPKVELPQRRYYATFKPRKIELNEKEALIKGGLQAGRHAYPTLDDIKSDWSDKDEKSKKGGGLKHDKIDDKRNVLKIPALEEKSDEKHRKSNEVFGKEGKDAVIHTALVKKSVKAAVLPEITKKSNETAKASSGTPSSSGEIFRVSGETLKTSGEIAKNSDETEKISAEILRVFGKTLKASDEIPRTSKENPKKSGESSVPSAETLSDEKRREIKEPKKSDEKCDDKKKALLLVTATE
ncbi:unnamed protein product [Strongylus vulgaris]|uniref:Uncharacterized protein n=1 Tax=Strongylus vulgaris TaxID=40348 RepID=A0A3P7IAI8_STRVU|nr:unnamed protein product [Strongylus vulgaris]